jgi:hypothetical protein
MSKFNEGIGFFNTKITLKHTVFGYKTDDKNDLAVIVLSTVVGFSIYKFVVFVIL